MQTQLLLNCILRFIPQHVFRSWIFWAALVVMIIGILLYHNGYFGKRSKGQSGKKTFNGSSASTNPDAMRIRYSGKGRSGYVHYQSSESRFSMYYEFGGGDCIVWIDVPSTDKWEKVTGLPLSRRDEVLNAIGKQVVIDQVSSGNGYFRIEGNAINVYS